MAPCWLVAVTVSRAGWVEAGPVGVDGLVEVAADGTHVAVADADGNVWQTRDGGERWSRADLPALSTPEGMAGLDEVIDALRDAAQGADPDAAQEAIDRLGEVDLGVAEVRLGLAWDGATLWIGRPDGLWRGEGDAFQRSFEGATSAVAARSGVVVALSEGVPWSHSGSPGWQSPTGLVALVVRSGPDGFLAGTDDGLWYSPDGLAWSRAGGVAGPVVDVASDPYAPFAAWLAGDGVRRTTDLGQTVVAGGGAAIDAQRVVPLGERAAVVLGLDGLWRTVDGGWNWSPLAGLPGRDAAAIAASGGDLLVAGATGLWRWQDDAVAAEGVKIPEWIAVGAVIDAALRRRGSAPPLGNPWIATALPELVVEGQLGVGDSLLWVPEAGTTRAIDQDVSVLVRLTWAAQGHRVDDDGAVIDVDGAVDALEELRDDPQERLALGLDLERDPRVAALSMDRDGAERRRQLTLEVAQLWAVRQALAAEPARREVAEEVARRLRLAEVVARLDALTDGLISRYEVAARAAGGRP